MQSAPTEIVIRTNAVDAAVPAATTPTTDRDAVRRVPNTAVQCRAASTETRRAGVVTSRRPVAIATRTRAARRAPD